MKQTAVEQVGIAFRQWQKEWENFDKIGKDKPISYNEFIEPFLEMEKQQIIDACNQEECFGSFGFEGYEDITKGEEYYNINFKNK
jgi:hypothetical protein